MSASRRAALRSAAAWLHPLGLASLAFAQPVLDLLGRNPTFFAVRRSPPGDIALLAAAAVLAPGLAIVVSLAATRRWRPAAERPLQLVLVGALSTLIGWSALRAAGRPELWPAGFLLAPGAAWLYHRSALARSFVGVLSLALVAAPAAFLAQPGIRKLMSAVPLDVPAPGLGATHSVVMLVFDEWSLASILGADGELDAARLPHLAGLASRSSWYRQATAVSDVTELALPSMLSGTLPDPDRLPTFAEHPRTLFTLLGDSHRVWAAEPLTALCPDSLNRRRVVLEPLDRRLAGLARDVAVVWGHLVLPGPLTERLPPVDRQWSEFGARPEPRPEPLRPAGDEPGSFVDRALETLRSGRRHEPVQEMLRSLETEAEPSLHFLHVMLPHVPWEYLPSGRRYTSGRVRGLEREVWAAEPAYAQQAMQRYLAQVGYVDRMVGDVVDRLDQLDRFDDTLLVVTADHGAAFTPGALRRLFEPANLPEILPIPLFVKSPGQRQGAVVADPVSAVDLLAIVAGALGVRSPWPGDGRPPGERAGDALPFVGKYAGPQSVDPPAREAILARMPTPAGAGPEAFARVGPEPELVGRAVDRLDIDTRPLEGRLRGQPLSGPLGRSGEWLPALVAGSFEPAPGPSASGVAVAIGGRVVSTGPVFEEPGGGLGFEVLVPESALGEGPVVPEVFALTPGSAVRLQPIEIGPRLQVAMRRDAIGEPVALLLGEREVPIGDDPGLAGWLEAIREDVGMVSIRGWAVDTLRRRPADRVVLFASGKAVVETRPVEERASVVEHYGDPAFRHSGFSVEFVLPEGADLEREGVEGFALSGDGRRAARLQPLFRAEPAARRLVSTDGRVFTLRDEPAGFVEKARDTPRGLALSGWAADRQRGAAVERLVALQNGRYAGQWRVRGPRPDVARRIGNAALERAGFSLVARDATVEDLRSGRFRLLALTPPGEVAPVPLLTQRGPRSRAEENGARR